MNSSGSLSALLAQCPIFFSLKPCPSANAHATGLLSAVRLLPVSPLLPHLSPVLIVKEKGSRERESCSFMLGSCRGAVGPLHSSHRKANRPVACHSEFLTGFLWRGSRAPQSPGERINLGFSFGKSTIIHKGLGSSSSVRLGCACHQWALAEGL